MQYAKMHCESGVLPNKQSSVMRVLHKIIVCVNECNDGNMQVIDAEDRCECTVDALHARDDDACSRVCEQRALHCTHSTDRRPGC
jgi:hypothetical protein